MIGIFLRGLAMGACDVIPGISGGTIALITGIYERLIAAIKAFDSALVRLLLTGQWKRSWAHVDAGFLLSLGVGIGSAIILFSHLIGYVMEVAAVPFWSFFFGLIAVSAVLVWEHIEGFGWKQATALMCGAVLALWIGTTAGAQLPDTLWAYGLAGMIAIMAMLLPGISGSMLLVLMGKYTGVLTAVREGDLLLLAVFMVGCVLGVLVFSRVVHLALAHWHDTTMSMMLGLMLGSLVKVWPWRIENTLVSPWTYESVLGQHHLALAVLFLCLGVVVPLVIRLLGKRYSEK